MPTKHRFALNCIGLHKEKGKSCLCVSVIWSQLIICLTHYSFATVKFQFQSNCIIHFLITRKHCFAVNGIGLPKEDRQPCLCASVIWSQLIICLTHYSSRLSNAGVVELWMDEWKNQLEQHNTRTDEAAQPGKVAQTKRANAYEGPVSEESRAARPLAELAPNTAQVNDASHASAASAASGAAEAGLQACSAHYRPVPGSNGPVSSAGSAMRLGQANAALQSAPSGRAGRGRASSFARRRVDVSSRRDSHSRRWGERGRGGRAVVRPCTLTEPSGPASPAQPRQAVGPARDTKAEKERVSE
ncbi:unnamed protein product [Protopolystoma xenopodis]|uniref:Uncharacterized protein n=1 Tax=Protopolystoma xenopodis TaxID=117903 RepID=A0A448XQ59_9PLAT|nr:unnamed protein product [Protopolystoma xenopodis]